MTDKNNNMGYKGQTPMDAGAFYTPYIPLVQHSLQHLGWKNSLQTLADYYSDTDTDITETMTEHVWECMQKQWPGPYQVVAVVTDEDRPTFKTRYGNTTKMKRVEFRLHFANPEDETWWHVQYD